MLQFQSEYIGQPVIVRETASPCAKVRSLLIDHNSGKILGVETDGNKILAVTDILQWRPHIEIQDISSLVSPNEVIRIKEEIDTGIAILGNEVRTDKGTHIGKVIDYMIDLQKEALSSLHVAKDLLMVHFDKRLIPASQILEITKDAIIVKENLLKKRIPLQDLIQNAPVQQKSAEPCLNSVELRNL